MNDDSNADFRFKHPDEQESSEKPANEADVPIFSEPKLGSLAQSARTNQLRSARTTMYFVGGLTILANLFMVFGAEGLVENNFAAEMRQLQQEGFELDMAKVEEIKASAIRSTQLMGVGFVGVGIIFCILGAYIYKYPVPATVLALVLYLSGAAISAMIDPATVASGLVIKIIIIVVLAKAIQSALAYRRQELAAVA